MYVYVCVYVYVYMYVPNRYDFNTLSYVYSLLFIGLVVYVCMRVCVRIYILTHILSVRCVDTYIPILPVCYLFAVSLPTPFICGVHTSLMPEVCVCVYVCMSM